MEKQVISEEAAKQELEKGYEKAEKLLRDPEKMDKFLERLEEKLKVIPVAGEVLSMVPAMISLIRSYVKKEYTDIPIGTILVVISALGCLLSPVDLIPDFIPGVGYLDDAAIVAACLKLVGSDVEEYRAWREKNHKIIEQ